MPVPPTSPFGSPHGLVPVTAAQRLRTIVIGEQVSDMIRGASEPPASADIPVKKDRETTLRP